MADFRPAKKRLKVSVGESVRIIRELQGLSQNQLAERTGIPQATLSGSRMIAFVLEWSGPRFLRAPSSVIPQYSYSLAGSSKLNLRHNHAFERSARQRCCRVPSSLRSSAPAQRECWAS